MQKDDKKWHASRLVLADSFRIQMCLTPCSAFQFSMYTQIHIHTSHIKQWAITMRFAVIGFDLFEDENYDRQKDIFDLYE